MARHPPEFTDTDPRAMEVWLNLMSSTWGRERERQAVQLLSLVRRMWRIPREVELLSTSNGVSIFGKSTNGVGDEKGS